jgi:hypothetical protein
MYSTTHGGVGYVPSLKLHILNAEPLTLFPLPTILT